MNIHFKISLIKSIIRIVGSISALISGACFNPRLGVKLLSAFFLTAEILGIYEEIEDDRK